MSEPEIDVPQDRKPYCVLRLPIRGGAVMRLHWMLPVGPGDEFRAFESAATDFIALALKYGYVEPSNQTGASRHAPAAEG